MLLSFIQYTRIADERYISLFEQHPQVNSRAVELFSHVLNAQHIWCCRINGRDETYGRMQLHGTADFRKIHLENSADMMTIYGEADLKKEIHYVTANGDAFMNTVEDILLHACNHSTYHRAQIATLFRQDRIAPPVTDFVILKREGQF